MDKKASVRRMVFAAAALAVGVAAFWALLFVPRLGVHPQAVAQGVDRSSKLFFAVHLAATVVLLVAVVRSRAGGAIMSWLLYLGAGLLFLHVFMVFDGIIYYLETYAEFVSTGILMLVCVGADLGAGALAIAAGNAYRRLAKAA